MLATELGAHQGRLPGLPRHGRRRWGTSRAPQNIGYLWKVHVDETEELAEEAGRKYVQGPSNPFLAGNEGTSQPRPTAPCRGTRRAGGCSPRTSSRHRGTAGGSAGPVSVLSRPYEAPGERSTASSRAPPRLCFLKHSPRPWRPSSPGTVIFWDGDGAMTHDDAMRSLRLMGQEVLPAVREIADELDLPGPFEVDPATGKPYVANPPAPAPVAAGSGDDA